MAREELASVSDAELMERLERLKREQLNLRFQAASGQLEKPARIREVRRTIARIKTLQSARMRAARATN